MTLGTGATGTMTLGTGAIHPSGGTRGSTTLTSGVPRDFLTIIMYTTTTMTTSTALSEAVRTDTTGTGLHPAQA